MLGIFEPAAEAEFLILQIKSGNGFRLDQGFVNRKMISRLSRAAYVWGKPENGSQRLDALSDHAALILDFI